MAARTTNIRASRIVWTASERATIGGVAAETQRERPELSGLPLLRVAMKSLPINRRRKLVAVTQAPWFEMGLSEESRRRTAAGTGAATRVVAVESAADPYMPILAATREATKRHADTIESICKTNEEWKASVMQFNETATALLAMIYNELRDIRRLCGSPVPAARIDQSDQFRRPHNGHH